jgi:hypothetical protein
MVRLYCEVALDHRLPRTDEDQERIRIVPKKAEIEHEKAMIGNSDGAPALTLGTDDVHAAYERMREQGVRFPRRRSSGSTSLAGAPSPESARRRPRKQSRRLAFGYGLRDDPGDLLGGIETRDEEVLGQRERNSTGGVGVRVAAANAAHPEY